MAGRYLITGVQIGMVLAQSNEKVREIFDEIMGSQYLGNSSQDIKEDVKKVSDFFKKTPSSNE